MFSHLTLNFSDKYINMMDGTDDEMVHHWNTIIWYGMSIKECDRFILYLLVSSKTKKPLIWAIRDQYEQKAFRKEKFLEINIDKIFSNKTPINNLSYYITHAFK